jgi:hypothetical protein
MQFGVTADAAPSVRLMRLFNIEGGEPALSWWAGVSGRVDRTTSSIRHGNRRTSNHDQRSLEKNGDVSYSARPARHRLLASVAATS